MTKKMTRRTILVACFILVLAVPAFAGIVGSKHDFTSTRVAFDGFGPEAVYSSGPNAGWTVESVCVFCHTPHNAMTDSDAPGMGLNQFLWNRKMSSYQTYSVYSSPTLTTAISIDNPPKGLTLMCMSCHDGVTTIENIKTGPGGATIAAIDTLANQIGDIDKPDMLNPNNWGANIGEMLPTDPTSKAVNLSNDHPVSFTWVKNIPQINDPDATGKWANGLRLFNNRMECSTCHNVHDPSISPFLRASNSGSGICMTCHNK